MLKAENISVRYGDHEAVKDISFELQEGQWLMLCGPNGAGKSTLLGALAQTIPYAGRVTLQGENASKMKAAHFAQQVGVLAQKNHVGYAFTVEEIVRMGRYAHGKKIENARSDEQAVTEALGQTGLSDLKTRSVLSLSGGELQRVFLAQVLAQQPSILLLDEPANHLDLKFQQLLFDMIEEWLKTPGRAVIAVVHDLSLAKRYATHAMLMHKGCCIAQGEKDEVITREGLKAVYDTDVYAYMAQMHALWQD